MTFSIRVLESLSEVTSEQWDALVPSHDPFLRHRFLHGLEQTGCVGHAETGWVPRHLVASKGSTIVGALPLYEKYDSYGEYIFDWGFSHAAQRAGIPYYPKLVSAVPFTPATGRRFLLADDALENQIITGLINALSEVGHQIGSSSTHILFETETEQSQLEGLGYGARHSYQFHWEANPAWKTFDDYTQAMRSSARKQVHRERRQAASHGLTLRALTGPQMTPNHWQALWQFYCTTTASKGAFRYLNRAFFEYLEACMAESVVCFFAERAGDPVAGALCFRAGDHLYGRYWGSMEDFSGVHFELCYYEPIAWCLQNGIKRFEAGAQGPHKLKRGFLPTRCYSSHLIQHPALAHAVNEFLPRESMAVAQDMNWLNEHSPFKK